VIVRLVPIDAVTPYPQNPRKNDQAIEKVVTSIKEFGFRQPIVVDRDMVVVVGDTRLKAARSLGLAEVLVQSGSRSSSPDSTSASYSGSRSPGQGEAEMVTSLRPFRRRPWPVPGTCSPWGRIGCCAETRRAYGTLPG